MFLNANGQEMKIEKKLEKLESERLPKFFKALKCQVGFFGNHYYKSNSYSGKISFKQLIKTAEKILDHSGYPEKEKARLGNEILTAIKQIDLKSKQARKKKCLIVRITASISGCFSALFFNRKKSVARFQNKINQWHPYLLKSQTYSTEHSTTNSEESSSVSTSKISIKPLIAKSEESSASSKMRHVQRISACISLITALQGASMIKSDIKADLVPDEMSEQEFDEAYNKMRGLSVDSKPLKNLHIHPLEKTYQPKSVTIATGDLNQRKAGEPNGCTRFAVAFLEKPIHLVYTGDEIAELLKRKDLGIIPGVNDFAFEIVQQSKHLELVDLDGQPSEDGIPFYATHKGETVFSPDQRIFNKAFKKFLKKIFHERKIDGFVLTTATESLGFRLIPGSIEMFDSHGDSEQSSAAAIWTFSGDDAAEKITNVIGERILAALDDVPQIEIIPVLQK